MATENSGNLTSDYVEQRAIGVRGTLIRSLDSVLFRVYSKGSVFDTPDDFVDFDITNYDCEIVIIDPDAALIQSEAGNFLDYTTESMQIAK